MACTSQQLEYARKYRNRPEIKARQKAYQQAYIQNPENQKKINARAREYYKTYNKTAKYKNHKKEYNSKRYVLARNRLRESLPANKLKKREYLAKPHVIARERERSERRKPSFREYARRPEVKARRKAYRQIPAVQARRIAYQNKTARRQKTYSANAMRKLKILRHYGGPIPRCKRCHIVDVRFLVLDHIDNDGGIERKKLGKYGGSYYNWLIKNNFPSNLQVLCFYCNLIKQRKNN